MITKVIYSCIVSDIVKRIVGNIFNVQQDIRNIFKMSKNLKHPILNEKKTLIEQDIIPLNFPYSDIIKIYNPPS